MRCDEVQTLHGPYLDSELDTRTSLEIEQHLKGCPNCARLVAEAQKFEARLAASLKQGSRTAALWAQIEGAVAAAPRRGAPALVAPAGGWPAMLQALSVHVRAGWQRSRWAWAGLAAVWLVIAGLDFTAREAEGPAVAGQTVPTPAEVRLALKQKLLWMAELARTSEPASVDRPRTAPPGPRSDGRKPTLDT